MRAAQINEYGDASVVTINEVETPTITDDQVLVRVHAASLNPYDSTIRSGYMKDMIPLEFPITLGGDLAGTVEAVGANVTHVAIGDKVYGQANAVVAGNSGAFAEFAAVFARSIAKMPANLDFNQAASLPLIGSSAVQALTRHINLQSGQKIFIHGGGGNIGMVAIQVARSLDAYVATTATGDGIGVVTELGADEVIDYKTQDFAKLLQNYDAVYDTVGGDDFTKALAVLRPGGIAVSMAGKADEGVASQHGVTAISQMTNTTTAVLDQLTQLIESNIVTPHIAMTLPLEQISEAFVARESGTVLGKIVITLS